MAEGEGWKAYSPAGDWGVNSGAVISCSGEGNVILGCSCDTSGSFPYVFSYKDDGSPSVGKAPGISAGVYIGVSIGVSAAEVVSANGVSTADGEEASESCLWKRVCDARGECFEGSVLLRCTPLVVGVCGLGEMGLGDTVADCRDETDTLLRTPLYLLAPELERPMMLFGARPADGVDGPLSTSCFVFSSAPVPGIPIKKWS